jgi:hypothetical protein
MHGTPSEKSAVSKPLPVITPLNKSFWDNMRKGIFSLQACQTCGDRHTPEAPVCPKCLGTDQSWEPASGRGTLESWVEFHRAYWDSFAEELPYRVCLVRLEEGPLFISNFKGNDSDLAIGRRVKVVFEPVTNEIILPKFAPE